MGIDALVASLVADGQAEAGRIRQAARDAATAMAAAAGEAAEARLAATRAAAEAELRTQVSETLFRARRESRRAVLLAREAALERVRHVAEGTLRDAHDDPTLRAVLPTVLQNARDYLPAGAAIVHCHPRLGAVVREAVRAWPDVEVREDASVPAGVVLQDARGMVQVEETLPARLARSWPALRMPVARQVAPGQG